MAARQSLYWCFTLNNYTDDDIVRLERLAAVPTTEYLIYGRELGQEGTPHLQGFVMFTVRRRFNCVKRLLGDRYHIEAAVGTPYQAALYCKKDGDFTEFGTAPVDRLPREANRGQFANYVSWVTDYYAAVGLSPTPDVIARNHPALFTRYRTNLLDLTERLCPNPSIQDGELRGWQIDLNNRLHEDPDDRTIDFVFDEEGGKGKSFFYRWFYTNNMDITQLLSSGSRNDIAHAVDPFKSVFLFNIPRCQMEYLQYAILEQLKDRVVFSPKYNSTTKLIRSKCHVVVFCNERPDYTKLSEDRINLITL